MDKQVTMREQYGELELSVVDKNITSEISNDFSLPDYQPEIKRLLRVMASPLPPSKFFGAGEAEFTGNIDYYVLYMGSDNEIYCSPLTGEYSITVPIEKNDYVDITDKLDAVVRIVPENVSGRVTSPRHVTVKCRLRTHVCVYGDGKILTDISGDNENTEKLYGDVENARLCFGTGEVSELNDEMISDNRDGDVRVICADGHVLISEVSSGKDEVICRGEVQIKLLIGKENGDLPVSNIRRMPFSGIIACDGANPEAYAYAKGTLSELAVTVEEGRIVTECGIILECICQKNEKKRYLADVYSICGTGECTYETISVSKGICCFNKNFTFSESVTLQEAEISDGLSVADSSGVAVIDGYDFENGKCKIFGKCRFNVQLSDGTDYSSREVELPFKYEYDIPVSCGSGNLNCGAESSMISCRVRIDGERIAFDSEIALYGRIWENCEHTFLGEYRQGDSEKRKNADITVCYPKRDDTLWSVAKRYSASIDGLICNNNLSKTHPLNSSASLDGVDFLII